MEKTTITNHTELLARIEFLKLEKSVREEDLKLKFKDFVTTLNPILLLKNSLHQLANDKEVRLDIAKVGMNIGSTFIIDRLFGRQRSIKGFLSAMLLDKISSIAISNNGPQLIAGLRKLIRPKNNNTNQPPPN